ncbi:hypothetical protein D3C80_1912690 [compost metagenome]
MRQVDDLTGIHRERPAGGDRGNRTLYRTENVRHHCGIDRLLRIIDIEDEIAIRVLRKPEIQRHLWRLGKPVSPTKRRSLRKRWP